MMTAGTILNGAFGLVTRRPGAVLVWMAIHALIGLGSAALIGSMLPNMLASLAAMKPGDPNHVPFAAMQGMWTLQLFSWGLNFVIYFVAGVLMCAAFRLTLEPEAGGIAGIRIGNDELRTFLMILVISFAAGFVIAIVALILFLVGMIVYFLTRDMPAITVLVAFALVCGGVGGIVYCAVRLSLVFAVSFIRHTLTVDEAWRITAGRFWTLFLPYLAIWLVSAIISSLVFVPLAFAVMAGLPNLATHASGTAPPEQLLALQAWFAGHAALFGAFVVVASALQGFFVALYGGAMATAAQGFMFEDGLLEPATAD